MSTPEFDLSQNDFQFDFGNKAVTLVNPCPKTLTSEIYAAAKMRRTRLQDGQDFVIDVEIGTAPNHKRLTLSPGQTLEGVPENIAQTVIKAQGHRGICILDPKDPYMSMIQSLEKAAEFRHLYGEEAQMKVRESLGHDEDTARTFANKYGPFFLNMAREQALEKHIVRLHELRESWLAKQEETKKTDLSIEVE